MTADQESRKSLYHRGHEGTQRKSKEPEEAIWIAVLAGSMCLVSDCSMNSSRRATANYRLQRSLPLSFVISRQPWKFRRVLFFVLPFFFWQVACSVLPFT